MNKFKDNFVLLERFLKEKYNVKVISNYDTEDTWIPSIKTILINKNNRWRDRLVALVHESGHVLIDIDNHSQKMCLRSEKYEFEHDAIKSKAQFISLLNEEICAWNLGKTLADVLNIELPKDRVDEVMTKSIMSYVKFGLKDIYGKTIDINTIDARL